MHPSRLTAVGVLLREGSAGERQGARMHPNERANGSTAVARDRIALAGRKGVGS